MSKDIGLYVKTYISDSKSDLFNTVHGIGWDTPKVVYIKNKIKSILYDSHRIVNERVLLRVERCCKDTIK